MILNCLAKPVIVLCSPRIKQINQCKINSGGHIKPGVRMMNVRATLVGKEASVVSA